MDRMGHYVHQTAHRHSHNVNLTETDTVRVYGRCRSKRFKIVLELALSMMNIIPLPEIYDTFNSY